jgi:hypothetical protein
MFLLCWIRANGSDARVGLRPPITGALGYKTLTPRMTSNWTLHPEDRKPSPHPSSPYSRDRDDQGCRVEDLEISNALPDYPWVSATVMSHPARGGCVAGAAAGSTVHGTAEGALSEPCTDPTAGSRTGPRRALTARAHPAILGRAAEAASDALATSLRDRDVELARRRLFHRPTRSRTLPGIALRSLRREARAYGART